MDSMGQGPPGGPRRVARHRAAGLRRSRWASALSTVLATVLAAAAAVALDTGAASAATVDTNAWYVLVNRNSGKAMDVAAASTSDGAVV
ncbi:MAG: RICIN domain-containing protein, partial [Saccharothrix sp.]|nr:RICIN domain-containing protein [Saccharothrix sp.]